MDDDRALVTAFLETGDEEAFRLLYRRHTGYLYGLALRLTRGSEPEAAEIVQHAWIRATRVIGRFSWRSRFTTWLAGILVNCHREHVRSRSRHPVSDPPLHDMIHSDDGRRVETGLDLETALGTLADGYREIVVLYHVYGYSHAEIAGMLGISEGTSRSQLTRGLARLRDLLT